MSRSNFPNAVDSFKEKLDPTPENIAQIIRWQTLQAKTNKTALEVTEYQNLTTVLANMIFTAEDYNKLASSIVSAQDFFLNNTAYFIDSLKNEANNYINDLKTNSSNEVEAMKSETSVFINDLKTSTQEQMTAYTLQFEHKGQYSNTTAYKKYNSVYFQGSSYWCKKDCTGIAPTNTEYWNLSSAMGIQGVQGEKGDDGVNLIYKGQYDPLFSYDETHLTTYAGQLYHNTTPCMGIVPTNTEYWEVAVQKGASTSLRYFRSKSDSQVGVAEVFINIPNFTPSTDTLMVYIDGNLARLTEDYTVVDNAKIKLVNFNEQHEVDFVLFKSVLVETNYALTTYPSMSFDSANWSFDSSSGLYETTLYDSKLANALRIDVNFTNLAMMDLAMKFEVLSYTKEVQNGVKIFARRQPDVSLVADITVFAPSV